MKAKTEEGRGRESIHFLFDFSQYQEAENLTEKRRRSSMQLCLHTAHHVACHCAWQQAQKRFIASDTPDRWNSKVTTSKSVCAILRRVPSLWALPSHDGY